METIKMEKIKELLKKAVDLNAQKKYIEVINILNYTILNEFNNADLYIEKAKAFGNLKNYEECKNCSELAKQLDPSNVKAYYYIGRVYSAYKEYEKAIVYYSKAIEIDPNDVECYNGLGYAYYQLKKYDKAINIYKKSISIDSKNPRSFNELGSVYLSQKEYDKAIEQFKKVIEIDDKYHYVYNEMGNVYFDQNKYIEAIEYYNKYINLDPNWGGVYRNRAMCFFNLEKYNESLADYKKYIEIADDKNDFRYKNVINRIEEIERRLKNKYYEEISEIVNKIKELLIYNDGCVTHFTSLSTSKILIIENSRLRLSEGAFLNDTSEGMVLFKYLLFSSNLVKNSDTIDEIFTQKPFIGSFVSETKHNDLAMWRMYGKEKQEEAKGCAITIDIKKYRENIYKILGFDETSFTFNQEFKFYRVCYIEENGKFTIPDIKNKSKKEKELNTLMDNLKKVITRYNQDGDFKDINKIEELLNGISFLVKNSEYSYEKEIRLVVNGVGFEKKIECKEQPRVYIELASLGGSITKITLGPKVEKSDEWASVFHYSIENEGYEPEIHISHLPYK
jgi:tetratricopeptide (TPR) repeat protein